MGDMREYFEDLKEINKQKRVQRNEKYEPQLIKLGAIEKSSGVYELNGWFCYPTKGFAMNRYNTKQRMSLDKFIKQHKETKAKRITEKNFQVWERHYKYPLSIVCLELLNGEYTLEDFRKDVLSWE